MQMQRWLALSVAGVSVGAGLSGTQLQAADLSSVLGVAHIDGQYYLSSNNYLSEGADQVLATGSKTIKLEMDSQYKTKYDWNSSWGSANSLVSLAQSPYFSSVFSKPLSTYVLTTYSFGAAPGQDDTQYWLNGFTSANAAAETKQFYDLTKYLLTSYKGTGKTFVLSNWEGDWALRGTNRNTQPSASAVQNMISWINARQAGIDQARAEVGSDVHVYGAVEANRVADAMNPSFTWATVANNVLPYTNVDLASYSSYDTMEDPTNFPKAVDYLASKLPSSATFGQSTHSVYIGEFGEGENIAGTAKVNSTMNNVLSTVQSKGLPYAIYWEVYCNELQSGATAPANGNDSAVKGFWMVKPDGSPATAWHQYRNRIITSDPTRATTTAIKGTLKKAYSNDFSTSLGSNWTTSTYGGAMSVTANAGRVEMRVVNNASAYPYGTATLSLTGAVGRGLNPGEFVEFTVRRENDTGIVGVDLFGTHHGSGIGSGTSSLDVWSNNAWTPVSFATDGTNPKYDWDTTRTISLHLDSADGQFATVSYYVDGTYSGSWLYETTAKTLDSIGFFAQSNVLNSGFEFDNLAVYTVPEPSTLGVLVVGGMALLTRRRVK